ncbi:MAG: membrane protein YczE [Fidelibacterota bacterium]|jgi:uncharacterized membrane protein YczE|nr:hypothetical protein [Candidatus Neomarinimicrobiota bacterium]|tara:strand:+ start:841 stop:1503 length:663 start_codon:yes stop_codon:yes gene_type:complete
MFLKIKNIPDVSWSSNNPLNFKPRLKTFVALCLGLIIFGFGSSLLFHATIGNSPWVVLAEGLSIKFNWSIGLSTFICSIIVLSMWIPLGQKPGLGTIMNIIIIAGILDLSIYQFDFSSNIFFINFLTALLGTITVGVGSGIYLIANLGSGPRDGLMTGLQKKYGYTIASVRTSIEVTVVLLGWFLGGTVGIGTLIFAFGIGPAVAFGLYLIGLTNKKAPL